MFYDAESKDYYYHNPHTNETVWDRPEGADIVCLENLQQVSPSHPLSLFSPSFLMNTRRVLLLYFSSLLL